MLRLNLLPKHYAETATKQRWMVLWAAVLAATVVGFIIWLGPVSAALAQANDEKTKADGFKTEYDSWSTKEDGVNKNIAETKAKQDFVSSAQKYNSAWPATFNMVRNMTSTQILLKSMSIDGSHQVVMLTGFARDEMTVVRWWMYLKNQTDKLQSVFITLPVHGYTPETAASAAPGVNPFARRGAPPAVQATAENQEMVDGRNGLGFTATLQLKAPIADGITLPMWPAGGGGGGGGGFGGRGGPGGQVRNPFGGGAGGGVPATKGGGRMPNAAAGGGGGSSSTGAGAVQ